MPEIVNSGYLYIAQPPLYLLNAGKKKHYVYTDDQKDQLIEQLTDDRKKGKGSSGPAADEEVEPGTPVEDLDTSGQEPDVAVIAEDGGAEETTIVDDEDKRRLKDAGITGIQRYKGLGEMNADQLWETTMDPANRILLRVDVEDTEKADAIFNKLMGEEVLLRKNFIQTHAKSVTNLDI